MSGKRIVRGPGLRGPKGVQGEKGPKGDIGSTGGQGPQGLPGTGAVPADEAVAGYIQTAGTSATKAVLSATFASRANGVVSVKDYGAKGDGSTDDTAAINAAVVAAAGRTVYLPAGTYMVDARISTGKGIRLNVAGTHLRLDPSATIQVIATAAGDTISNPYAAVYISATDCTVSGGAIRGDLDNHIGTTGEFGFCVEVLNTAHRTTVQDVTLSRAWGDGILVGMGAFGTGVQPDDVRITNIISTDNRRQAASVLAGNRLRINGSQFRNSGVPSGTPPRSGLALEPNPSGLEEINDALIANCTFTGNAGRGFYVNPNGRPVTATLSGCIAKSNGAEGFATEKTASVAFVGCRSLSNGNHGYIVGVGTTGATSFTSCESVGNTGFGFSPSGTGAVLNSCTARDNTASGFYLSGPDTRLNSCTAIGNCTAGTFPRQFDMRGTGLNLVGCVSDAGLNATKPTHGFQVISSATGARLIGCSAIGTFGTAAYAATPTDTVALPVPGVAKQTGTPAAATDAATTQALANDLRAKMLALGLIT